MGVLRVIMPFFDVLRLKLALLLWFGPILGHFRSSRRGGGPVFGQGAGGGDRGKSEEQEGGPTVFKGA